MQLHGIGNEEHSAKTHQVTNCMHDHPHYKMEGEIAKGASATARAQSQQSAQTQGEGQFSLSTWLEKNFSKGKSLLRSIWGQAGEAGDKSGQAQVMAQIDDSRDISGSGRNNSGQQSHQPDSYRTPQVTAQVTAAVTPPRAQEEMDSAAAQAVGGQDENLWRKIKVRFKDMAGQLTGYLRGSESRPQASSSFQTNQGRPREEQRRMKKPGRDAVEIDSYHVEESYLLDSYDRKGGYSKLSTKK